MSSRPKEDPDLVDLQQAREYLLSGNAACVRVAGALARILRGASELTGPVDNPPEDGRASLVRACLSMGIEVIDGHVSERDTARLIGRSAATLKRRRLTDRPMDCFKYLGRTRYALSEIARFKSESTKSSR